MNDFTTITVETDLLILGGGMAACGAAVRGRALGEAARPQGDPWSTRRRWTAPARSPWACPRSTSTSASKDGQNTVRNYVDYVRNDLMGVARDDLVASVARHVDSTVHLFEKWGLPIWKDENGAYVHEGRWQLMINGESYRWWWPRPRRTSSARQHLRAVFIVGPLMDGEECKGGLRLLGARERVLRLPRQGDPGRDGRRGARVQATLPRRGPRPRLVPAVELGLLRLLHSQGRLRDDLPGGALHPGPLQGRLRPGRRLVPALQVPRHQCLRRRVHGRAARRTRQLEALPATSSRSRPTSATTSACST